MLPLSGCYDLRASFGGIARETLERKHRSREDQRGAAAADKCDTQNLTHRRDGNEGTRESDSFCHAPIFGAKP